MSHILAIDQGTTSSRAIVFRADISIASVAQQEFPQHFPASGWVEHEPEDIWTSTIAVCREALTKANLAAKDIAAIGITNQRETTVVWDRATGKAVHRAIVWQDRRTADICAKLKSDGHEPVITQKTGLIIDPYFSGTKVAWILDQVPGARKRAEAGELLFGTVDSYLLWRLTGGKVHATDATNASRTLLFNIHTGQWDDELLNILRVPRSMLPEVKDSSAKFGDSVADMFGGAIAISGIAGDQQAATIGQACFTPGMIKSTYGTGCFALLNTGSTPVVSKNKLLTTIAYQLGGQTHLRAGRLDLRRRQRGAVAARRARPHQAGRRDRPARRQVRLDAVGLSGAGLRRHGRAVLESERARRAVRADAQHRPRRARACRAGERVLPDLRFARGDARRLAGAAARPTCCASTAA